ncbi:hypothetical protein H0H92_000147 [Tricholoma furcatifolium]|nr:hypothetical protein H0H92_000147 [Tricholoma furcatifolium]
MDVSTVKAEVKAWERSFKAENGRDPTIQDIKDIPHIAAKYKLYKKLSKQTTASSVASSSTSDTPATPPRLVPRSRQLAQPRNIATTAPLASFNPFSPQKNKGKAKAQVDERPKPSKSPFKPKVLSPRDPFPAPDPHKPSTSSETPPAPSSDISRARKRLRGEPVSPTPNKEKRRRVGSQLTLPFTDLTHDPSDNDNDEGDVTKSSFLSESPVKAPSGIKSFKLLFDEKAKSEAALPTGRSVIDRTKTQSTSRNLFGIDSAIGHDEDALWELNSQPRTTLFKISSTLPPNDHSRIAKAKVHTGTMASKISAKRALSDSDTESVDGLQHLSPVTSTLIPPSPSADDSSTSRQSQLNNVRGKSKADVSKRRKVKPAVDEKMDDQSESDNDSDSLHVNVKILNRTQADSNPTGHMGASDGSDSDPILGYLHRVPPHGQEAHGALDAHEGTIEVELPDKLRSVLALNSAEHVTRSIREERMVKGLVLGRRTDHYDPDRGGEIWDVGEDTERIDGEHETRGDTEGEDDWEGEPVPWAAMHPEPDIIHCVESNSAATSFLEVLACMNMIQALATHLRLENSTGTSLNVHGPHPRGPGIKQQPLRLASRATRRHRTPSTSYEQKMQPGILRDPDVTNKLFEAILDAPNGKRMLSRVARTCRAMCEPALNILWRDLDSLVPILWQFPGHMLKKARKPGMGFVKSPSKEDWDPVFKYSQRVRQITYNEASNNVAASIFTVLQDSRPQSPILPHLVELNWKAETPAGLARLFMFLTSGVRSVNLEVGTRMPQIESFLADMISRTKLTSFSFVSPTSLPDSFTDLLGRQASLDRLVLMAPGALSPGVGRWIASLPQLKTLKLDLTGRSMIAVEGFFDELRLRSGDSTPSSVVSTDSGVFSEEEVDFSLIRKSVLRLTGDLTSKGSFTALRKLYLTGEVSNIAVFIKHIAVPLVQLELVIEDPPDRADWHDLSALICEKFGNSLQLLRVTASSSSRSTDQARTAYSRLSLEQFTYLPCLTRLEIDLPESIIFTETDVQCLVTACPSLEVLKLCPLARFSSGAGESRIDLNTISQLLSGCRRLHTVATVIDAKASNQDALASLQTSSKSLARLHVGHSRIEDSLQVAIFLSHIAPNLDTLKWFQEKNRPGFVEANARNWQGVMDLLPHLQGIRSQERRFAQDVTRVISQKITVDKSVDATVKTCNRGVYAAPQMRSDAIQVSAKLIEQIVQANPDYASAIIDATPSTVDTGIDAIPPVSLEIEDVNPPSDASKPVKLLFVPSTFLKTSLHHSICLPSIVSLFSLVYKLLVFYPLSLPSRIFQTAASRIRWNHSDIIGSQKQSPQVTPSTSTEPTNAVDLDIPLDTLAEVRC